MKNSPYKYNKPIRNIILNYIKVTSDSNITASTQKSRDVFSILLHNYC